MAVVNLEFGTSIDLESGEEILFKCINNPKVLFGYVGEGSNLMDIMAAYKKADTFGQTLLTKLTLGIAGAKLTFRTNIVITNKRLVLIPFPKQKRTKGEMYTTQSFYYNKDIKGARALHTHLDKEPTSSSDGYFELEPVKGVDLKGLSFSLRIKLTQEELNKFAAAASTYEKLDNNLTYKLLDLDYIDLQVRMAEFKSSISGKNGAGYTGAFTGGKSVLPVRDYLVWLINTSVAEAK